MAQAPSLVSTYRLNADENSSIRARVFLEVVRTFISILDFVSCKIELDSNTTGYIYLLHGSRIAPKYSMCLTNYICFLEYAIYYISWMCCLFLWNRIRIRRSNGGSKVILHWRICKTIPYYGNQTHDSCYATPSHCTVSFGCEPRWERRRSARLAGEIQ